MKKIIFLLLILHASQSLYANSKNYKPPLEFGVDFHNSIESISQHFHRKKDRYNQSIVNTNSTWKKAYDLYTNYLKKINHTSLSQTETIPKIIHQIWIQGTPPKRCLTLRDTWLKHHPEWEYILWTDKTIKEFGLVNEKLYKKIKNYGAKSDIARYEILYRLGGLYIDTDFECLQSMDFLHHSCGFYTGLAYFKNFLAYNGLIACKPGHPILEECIEKIKTIKPASTIKNVIHTLGPVMFSGSIKRVLERNIEIDDILLLPSTYIYPWPHFDSNHTNKTKIKKWIRPESLTLHHWHASWIHTG